MKMGLIPRLVTRKQCRSHVHDFAKKQAERARLMVNPSQQKVETMMSNKIVDNLHIKFNYVKCAHVIYSPDLGG